MKPDGVDTAAMEPMEAIGAEPLVEGTATEEDPQQDPLQSHSDEAEKQQQLEMPAAPPAAQEGNSKPADAKTKAKGPGKTKPGTAAVKSSTAGPGSRPGTAQNRPVNGVQKPLSNGVQKKVTGAVPEKKPATATTAASRKPAPAGSAKVPARKSGGSSNGPGTAVPAQPKKGPAVSPADGVKAKPKMAASKPAAAKPDRSAVSKATRPAGGPPPRPTSTTTAGKPVVNSTTTSRPAASRATAPPAGRNTAAQPTKPTTAKKDVSKLTTVPVKKPAAAPTRPPPAKTAKSDAPKTSTAARPEPAAKRTLSANKPADAKTSRPKLQDGKPAATRVGTASPRSIGSKPGLSKTAAASPKKPESGGAPVPVRKSSKAKPPAQPLSASGEPAKEEEPPKPANAAEAAAVAGSAAAAVEATPTEPQLAAEQEPASVGLREEQLEPELDVQPTSTTEVEPVVEALAQEVDRAPPSVDVLLLPSSPAGPTEGQSPLDDQSRLSPKISVAPKNLSPEMGKQEGVEKVCKPVMEADMFVPKNVGAEELVDLAVQPQLTTLVPAEIFTGETPVLLAQEPGLAVEKADEEINEDNDYGGDVEEEEKEVSQQISVSEMSGTQPTEDSRPGSAGLAGSMWRGGALVSELDSEDVSCSQQGASELSAPGVLEGTESLDDLGEASLKGADGEGASAGSPDLEIVPDIPANEEDEDDEDEEDRVCDMEVGSERAEDPRRARQEGEDEEEDEDVEMASEGVTESGLESYGNADEDDFAEDDRLDNLNRAQPPLLLSTAPHWAQANPLGESCTQPPPLAASALLVSPSSDPWQVDPDTPVQAPAEPWMEFGAPVVPQVQEPVFHLQVIPEPRSDDVQPPPAAPAVEENLMSVEPTGLPVPARGMSQSSTLSGTELAAQSSSDTSTPEELREYNSSSGVESEDKLKTPVPQQQPEVEPDTSIPLERGEGEEEETLPADEVLGGPATAPTSDPSSPSASGDEASDTEGEMLVRDPSTLGSQTLPATEEREEAGQLPYGEGEDGGDTPQSANSVASYGFDCTTSNSNAHSTQSPGIFSLENEDQLLEETKDPTIKELTLGAATAEPPLGAPVDLLPLCALGEIQSNPEEQEYMLCGKRVAELPEQSPIGENAPAKAGLPLTPQEARDGTDGQPAYYSAICEKTDSVLAGGCELQPNQQPPPAQSQANHVGSVAWKTYSQPPSAHPSPAWQPADPQSSTPQAQPNLQLRRLEQHQKHLQQIQERQEQQSRERRKQLELEAELRELEEEEEENEEEDEEKLWREQRRKLEKQRQDLLQLQFQHQQQELKHRQQILQWQQELVQQQHKTQSAVLQSPTSVLCTIYEAREASDEEGEEVGDDMVEEKNSELEERVTVEHQEGGMQEEEKGEDSQVDQGDPKIPDLAPLQRPTKLSPRADQAHLDLDWDKKVDIVQQLINQTLLLAGDGCPPLLLLPGGGGGTLSPLESSMWPTLLPPLTPPSATVTSVSSFSPEDQGSSPQGEWTVVELETHH